MRQSTEALYVIGDGSGVTHSLSHASASGVFVAREIAQREYAAAESGTAWVNGYAPAETEKTISCKTGINGV